MEGVCMYSFFCSRADLETSKRVDTQEIGGKNFTFSR